MSERILVAVDGSEGAAGALRIAHLLSRRDGSYVEALTVYDPPPVYAWGSNVPVPDPDLDRYHADAQLRGVRSQARAIIGHEPRWRVHAQVGAVAPTIAKRAAEGHFSKIVLGIGRHRPVDRLLGSETALRVVQLAHIPVLAVPRDAFELPGRAVVVVDFSDMSIDAAYACASVMRDGGEVHLVHARWAAGNARSSDAEWMRTYDEGARTRLGQLASELASHHNVKVHHSMVQANMGNGIAQALLDTSRNDRADLIAAGSHGWAFLGRVLLGSVSTHLLRSAHCSVLLSPPPEIAKEIEQTAEHDAVARAR